MILTVNSLDWNSARAMSAEGTAVIAGFTGRSGAVKVGWQTVLLGLGDAGVWPRFGVPVMRAITATSCFSLNSFTNFCRDSLLFPKFSTTVLGSLRILMVKNGEHVINLDRLLHECILILKNRVAFWPAT